MPWTTSTEDDQHLSISYVAVWHILTKNLDAVQKENVGTLDSQICMQATTTQNPPALEVVANLLGYNNLRSPLWDKNVLKSTKGLQSVRD